MLTYELKNEKGAVLTMKKKALLLMAYTILGTQALANFNFHNTEIEVQHSPHRDRTEVIYRLAEGSYKINDTWSFNYEASKTHWSNDHDNMWRDISFLDISLNQYLPLNDTWYLYTTYQYLHNGNWNADSHKSGVHEYGNYNYYDYLYASAYFGRSYKFMEKDWYLGVKIDQQFGKILQHSFPRVQREGDITGLNLFTGATLTENLKLELANYHLAAYNEFSDKYDYWLKGEMTLEHTLPLKHNFSIVTELYAESTRYIKTDQKDVVFTDAYLLPQLQYKKEIKEKISFHASLGYELVSYYYWTGDSNSGWKDKKVIGKAGFKYQI